MKLTTQTILLIGAFLSTTHAAPAVESSTPLSDTKLADESDSDTHLLSHTEAGASTENPGFNATLEDEEAARHAVKCITFTSDNPDWHYNANDGPGNPWHKVGAGQFGHGPKKLCFPRTRKDGAGGAVYVGTQPKPVGDNTKLECFFPFSGKGNCDVSLVQGYSLSVTCEIFEGPQKHKIGGPKNLWQTHQQCPDRSEITSNICKNDFGAKPNELSDVKPFFREGVKDGNHYCVVWDCKNFPVTMNKDIKCHISGGRH